MAAGVFDVGVQLPRRVGQRTRRGTFVFCSVQLSLPAEVDVPS